MILEVHASVHTAHPFHRGEIVNVDVDYAGLRTFFLAASTLANAVAKSCNGIDSAWSL